MKVSRPLSVPVAVAGVRFAESVHGGDFRMSERADTFHKVILVLAGRVTWVGEGGMEGEDAGAGMVLVVPAGVRHRLRDREAATLLLLCCGVEAVRATADLMAVWSQVARGAGRAWLPDEPTRRALETWWRRGLWEQAHRRVGRETVTRALAGQILVALARQAQTPGEAVATAGQRVAALVREVEETFFDEWALDRAAERAGLSRRRFSALWREATGRAFAAHLIERRLAHAARLLRGGEHTVLGVIFSCGFGDVSHFYRQFRTRYGMTPKAWMAEAGVVSRLPGKSPGRRH